MINKHEPICADLSEAFVPLFLCRLLPLQSCLKKSSHNASGLAQGSVDKSMDSGIGGILGESFLFRCMVASMTVSGILLWASTGHLRQPGRITTIPLSMCAPPSESATLANRGAPALND